jgi:hypothetical protein
MALLGGIADGYGGCQHQLCHFWGHSPVKRGCRVRLPDKTSSRLPRLLPRLQTKLSVPSR